MYVIVACATCNKRPSVVARKEREKRGVGRWCPAPSPMCVCVCLNLLIRQTLPINWIINSSLWLRIFNFIFTYISSLKNNQFSNKGFNSRYIFHKQNWYNRHKEGRDFSRDFLQWILWDSYPDPMLLSDKSTIIEKIHVFQILQKYLVFQSQELLLQNISM